MMSRTIPLDKGLEIVRNLKYGSNLVLDTEPGAWGGIKITPLKFTCSKCSTTVVRTVAAVMRSRGCAICCKSSTPHPLKYTKLSYEKALKNIGKSFVMAEGEVYIDSFTRIKHRCLKHGNIFSATPNNMMGKGNCPECSFKKRSKGSKGSWLKTLTLRRKQCLEAIAAHGKVVVLGKIRNPSQAVRAKCLIHDFVWNPTAANLAAGHGCPNCRMDAISTNRFKRKEYLGKIIQGYEHFGIDYLIKKKRIPLKYISGGVGEFVPIFNYSYLGKTRRYFPDFFIKRKNLIVEVKSSQSAGFKDPKIWEICKAKAKCVLEAGYNYEFLIMNHKGERLLFPNDWMSLSHEIMRSYIIANRLL